MSRPTIRAVDWVVAGCAVAVVVVQCDFLVRYGPLPEYLINLVLHAGLVPAMLYRRARVISSFLASYLLLAGLLVLDWFSRVNLGVSPALLCGPLSLLTVTRWAPSRRWGVAALMAGIAGSFVGPLRTWGDIFLGVGASTLVLVACFIYASSQRNLAERHATALVRQAEQDEAQAIRAREAERTMIAREIHDIVAHSLTVIRVQAAVGLTLGVNSTAREVLETIKQTSGSALGEVRGLVDSLRDDDIEPPAGDLGQLPALIDIARAAGVHIASGLPDAATLSDWQARWSSQSRLTLLRVVQESLTNVIKHGGPGAITQVAVEERDGSCEVTVSNSCASRATSTPGYGLVGLQERMRTCGGTFSAGSVDGGFAVAASIPIRQAVKGSTG